MADDTVNVFRAPQCTQRALQISVDAISTMTAEAISTGTFRTTARHSLQVMLAYASMAESRSNSALNSQPRMAMAAIRYIQTSSAMLPPILPYITL